MRKATFFVPLTIVILMLFWGCSTSPTKSDHNGTPGAYGLDLSVDPDTMEIDTGEGIVTCFHTYNGVRTSGETIHFYTYAESISQTNITSSSESSTSSPTGTAWTVHYNPVGYSGTSDTIYACYYIDPEDTLARASVPVYLVQPDYELTIEVTPNTVYADTGQAIVSCTLTLNGNPLDGEVITFSADSEASSSSLITHFATSSSSSPSGTSPTVYYEPNDYAGSFDTIHALLKDSDGDTLAIDHQIVTIVHP